MPEEIENYIDEEVHSMEVEVEEEEWSFERENQVELEDGTVIWL